MLLELLDELELLELELLLDEFELLELELELELLLDELELEELLELELLDDDELLELDELLDIVTFDPPSSHRVKSMIIFSPSATVSSAVPTKQPNAACAVRRLPEVSATSKASPRVTAPEA